MQARFCPAARCWSPRARGQLGLASEHFDSVVPLQVRRGARLCAPLRCRNHCWDRWSSARARNFNFWLKQIRQADLKANIAYKVNRPNLSVMLEKWITVEIGYLKKSAKTSLKDQELSKATDMMNPKILSSLSVPELALYFKLMIDMKFIQVENLQDFFRHITRTYRTKNTENISFESIRSKFYQPENATIKAVKSKLIEALNQINLLS